MLARMVLLQLASLTAVIALPTIDASFGDVNSSVLARDKRDPSRSFTFSGFMPGSGMSAFASSADYSPYHHQRRPTSGWNPQGEYPAEPAPAEQPPERGEAKPWAPPGETEEAEGDEEEAPATRPPKKNRKKYKPQHGEDEDDYERPSRGGGGNANASFNAWFPIMFGMYPFPGQGNGQGVDGFRGAQGSRDPPGHTTVIANSVSHGRSGVASSHAVAYSGSQGSSSSGGQGSPSSGGQGSPYRQGSPYSRNIR